MPDQQQQPSPQQQDHEAKMAQIAAARAATTEFYQGMQSMVAAGQDLSKHAISTSNSWQAMRYTPEKESHFFLILGILSGGATFVCFMGMLMNAASKARGY